MCSVHGLLLSWLLHARGTKGNAGHPAIPQPKRLLLSPGNCACSCCASSHVCCTTARSAETSPVALLFPKCPVPQPLGCRPRCEPAPGTGRVWRLAGAWPPFPAGVPLGGARAQPQERPPQIGAPAWHVQPQNLQLLRSRGSCLRTDASCLPQGRLPHGASCGVGKSCWCLSCSGEGGS